MKFPAYAITNAPSGAITIQRVELDESELTPESNWTEAYPNSDPSSGYWACRSLDGALQEIRRQLEA
jgi:hypothetical protein